MNSFPPLQGIAALALAMAAAPLSAQVDPVEKEGLKPFQIVWKGGEQYPAVRVGQANWLVCAIPPSILDSPSPTTPELEWDGQQVATKILHLNREHGICLLESTKDLSGAEPFPIASRGKIVAGSKLTSLSHGESCHSLVAGKDFEYLGESLPCPLIRIRLENEDAHFCLPGTPLINEQGEIEGLLTHRDLGKKREAHAIPAQVIGKMVWEMENLQKSGPIWLGISFHTQSTTPEIMKISEDSPADAAGLKQGDVLLSINGHSVEGMPDLVELIHSLPAKKDASFKVLRDLKELDFQINPVFADENRKATTEPQ